mmetsp:Transcript_8470/g.24077  ORF Transcript_8470/g.24077 Transcript_8470/m.24077 type:complete len:279 (+) Transcript_8470:608-1444(+)
MTDGSRGLGVNVKADLRVGNADVVKERRPDGPRKNKARENAKRKFGGRHVNDGADSLQKGRVGRHAKQKVAASKRVHDFLFDELRDAAAVRVHAPAYLVEEQSVGQGMIGLAALLPPRSLIEFTCGEEVAQPLAVLHHDAIIDQLAHPVHTRAVRQDVANCDALFAALSELWPVLGHWVVESEMTTIHEHDDCEAGERLAHGHDDLQRVSLVWCCERRVIVSSGDVDHDFPLVIHSELRANVVTTLEVFSRKVEDWLPAASDVPPVHEGRAALAQDAA